MRRLRTRVLSTVLTALVLALATTSRAADAPATDWKLDSETFEGLRARSLGPGVMSGRISCIDGVPGERNTLWVGSAGGGVWRSKDNGKTWNTKLAANMPGFPAGAWVSEVVPSRFDAGTGYVQRTFNVSGFRGQTLRLNLTGQEDFSTATTFLVDDCTLVRS